MSTPSTKHFGLMQIEVQAWADRHGLSLDDLRQFLIRAEQLELPGDTYVTVGGLDEYANIQGRRSYWVKRIHARHVADLAKREPITGIEAP